MQISNMFGIDINKDVVWRVLSKYYTPTSNNDGVSWLTFIGHMVDSLWSVDFFRCESIVLKSYWVMVVRDQYTRRIIGFSVHPGDLDGITICRMFNEVTSKKPPPKYLSTDNDPLFTFHQWRANSRILEINEIKSIPYTPNSHPFIERLIRICRNELLNHILFWTKSDLQCKLNQFQQYYNRHRTHMGLCGDIPNNFEKNIKSKVLDINNYSWKSHCRGLFKLPVAA